MLYGDEREFSDLVGKIITNIDGGYKGSERIVFSCSDGTQYQMSHSQCCCEGVDVEEIHGDLQDLIGDVVIVASETSNENDQYTTKWTFYNIGTMNAWATIRWLGGGNGYYSLEVKFEEIKE